MHLPEPSFYRLTHDAYFVVELKSGHHWRLPKGTVVARLAYQPLSVLTEAPGEIYVNAPDRNGRIWRGWLAETVRWKAHTLDSHFGWGTRQTALSPWDTLRQYVAELPARGGYDKRGDPFEPWRIFTWACYYGFRHVPELHATIRQFTGTTFKSRDPVQVVKRFLSLSLHKEYTMSTIKEQAAAINHAETAKQEAAKAKAASKKGKRSGTKAPKAKRASMAHTVGAALLAICAKAKVKPLPGAAALEKGAKMSVKELQALRDAINATAAKLREAKKTALASDFSAQNRLVRRLERAAR